MARLTSLLSGSWWNAHPVAGTTTAHVTISDLDAKDLADPTKLDELASNLTAAAKWLKALDA